MGKKTRKPSGDPKMDDTSVDATKTGEGEDEEGVPIPDELEPEPKAPEVPVEVPEVEEAIPVTTKVQTRPEVKDDNGSWVTIRALKSGRSVIGVLTFDLVEGQTRRVPKEAANILVNGKRAVRMNIG